MAMRSPSPSPSQSQSMAGNMTGVLCDSASPPTALHPVPSGPRPAPEQCEGGGFLNKSAPAGRVAAPVASEEHNDDGVDGSTSTDAGATNLDATTVPVLASPSTRSSHKPNHARDSDTLSASASLSVVATALAAAATATATEQEEEAVDPFTSATPFPVPVPVSPIVRASVGGPSPSSLSPSSTGAASTPLEATATATIPVHPSCSSVLSPSLGLSISTPTNNTTVNTNTNTKTTTISTPPSPPLPLAPSSFPSGFQQGHRRNTPSRDSIPRQTVIKALASVVRHRKPEALSLDHSHSRIRPSSHSRSQSKSKSLSILYGMLPPTAGDNSQSPATSPVSSASVSDQDMAPATSAGTPTHNETQTLTDTLNDIAMSRLTAPAVTTPMATTPTPTTATLSNANIANSITASSKPGAATSPATPATATTANTSAAIAASAAAAPPTTANPLVNPLILPSTLQSPCFYHERFADAVDIGKVLEEIKNDYSMSHSRLVATATGVREVSKQLQRRPIRRAVRNIMIVTKARDNQLVYLTRELASWLLRTPRYGSDLGVNVYVDAKLRNSRRFDAAGILAENPRFQHMLKYWTPDLCWSQPEKFDLVLTLGGDGTVLFTSWLFQRIVPPVLSFSLGSLGFMTTFEFEKYKEHLNRVMGDDGMKINLRMRFTCTVYRGGLLGGPHLEEGEQFEVLNELVIDRGPSPYVSNLELYGDDELLTVVQADGCIFSTPTGSTAYSLSAGGALVHPDIPAILLTPICPHTLSFRPMVLSDTMALRVSIPRNSRATAYCAFDGKGRLELRQGDHVTITASQYPFPTVTRTDTEWFDSVSRTLRWNVRAAAQKPFDDGSPVESNDDQEDLGWDIDTDSAFYGSEEGSVSASPIRRQMSLLGL